MSTISAFLMSNIYLYICIIIVLIIIATILFIIVSNQKNRKKIKDDFVEAEKIETELSSGETSNTELEDIIKKMQEDIDVKPEDVVKKFEEEQEEKAIISYQELVDNVKAGKIEVVEDEESDVDYVQNLNLNDYQEPIPVETVSEETVTPEMVKEAIDTISTTSLKPKFKSSEFISPIYGVMEEKLDYPKVKKTDNSLDIMNTKDYESLTEEIKRQEEFLETLKAFRNSL